jgi:hypothetical protein
MSVTLTPEQEAQAVQLAEQMKEQAGGPFLAIARLLVATDESTLFGATEFAVRKHALEVISQAYSLHLDQKKTATAGPPSTARCVAERRDSTAIASATRKGSAE